jgi:polyisoprenoid-binding protein YceI
MRIPRSVFAPVACLALALTGRVQAAPRAFDFKDPKSINSVLVMLDSPLEPLFATLTGVSGTIRFDPDEPKKTSGKLQVEAGTVQFPNPGFTATARGPDGFDAEKHPSVTFSIKEIRNPRTVSPGVYTGVVVGDFTLRGVTKEVTADAKVSYLPGKGQERNHHPGDLLVLRSTFKLKRREFGIRPRMGDNLVPEEVEVRVAITGSAPP